MPTLEELLRASLKGANEKFDQANRALHAAVVETAKAVEAATDGRATVRLQEVDVDESGTRYSLNVHTKGMGGRDLAYFFLPQRGFPIYGESQNREIKDTFPSATALDTYFSALASDPDSPLVGYLAYVVRHLAAHADSTAHDPIPF